MSKLQCQMNIEMIYLFDQKKSIKNDKNGKQTKHSENMGVGRHTVAARLML